MKVQVSANDGSLEHYLGKVLCFLGLTATGEASGVERSLFVHFALSTIG